MGSPAVLPLRCLRRFPLGLRVLPGPTALTGAGRSGREVVPRRHPETSRRREGSSFRGRPLRPEGGPPVHLLDRIVDEAVTPPIQPRERVLSGRRRQVLLDVLAIDKELLDKLVLE